MLVTTLLQSTAKFSARKIPGVENTEAYMRASKSALATCSEYGDDVNSMLAWVKKLRVNAEKNLMPRRRLFSDPNKYYLLGLDHAVDVVSCIAARFENGYTSPDEVFVRNLLAYSKYKVK